MSGRPELERYRAHAMAKRPGEELYAVVDDPGKLRNLASDARHAATLRQLRSRLDAWMRDTQDPRATSDDDRFDRYPYYGPPATVGKGVAPPR